MNTPSDRIFAQLEDGDGVQLRRDDILRALAALGADLAERELVAE